MATQSHTAPPSASYVLQSLQPDGMIDALYNRDPQPARPTHSDICVRFWWGPGCQRDI